MLMELKIVAALSVVNILLLSAIIILNIHSYVKMRAQYTIFMLVFAAIFLIQNLMGSYFYFAHMSYYVVEVSRHILIIKVAEVLAFGYLLWMQWQ
jgi:hypothetical protein